MNVLRLYKEKPQIDSALVERYRKMPTPNICDCLEREYGSVGIYPIGNCLVPLNGNSMAGTAFTVKTRPGDNLVVHKALDLARPGDVLVIDARGDISNAILGELMTWYAKHRGIVGIVVDGAIRDSRGISENNIIPVFARGISHQGPYKSGPGEIHGDIQIGGMTVHDGDLIVGDYDGLVVIPPDRAVQIIDEVENVSKKESLVPQAIKEGRWDRSWIDPMLKVVEVE
ncbi:Regulator of ribonuclease activity A [bioreactor metagenome]|jgi:regulator of RNase E activity RraA|uniref:Regulator of ribonuclease activity A n=1 Tax=bioreactor metagenome TaxID=1076179 RepID=A0A644YKC1_9ZZZZ